MRKFDYFSLLNQTWDNEILGYVSAIHEAKGKQDLLIKQKPAELEKLVEIAKIQSTEASNAIEGIRTTETRLKQICREKTTPRNRDEKEIAGYRDVLNIIHESFEYIPITPNYIKQLHQIMYHYQSEQFGGKFKDVQNYISAVNSSGKRYTIFTPLSPIETPLAIEQICDEFNHAIAEAKVDPLILIPIFIHDFLCIHPFIDGNGRMSRLLTTLLLYRCGYLIGKYISLETKIAQTKDAYYDSLEKSQHGWQDNQDDSHEFTKYLLGIILSAYRDFEQRCDLITVKSVALDKVTDAVKTIVGKFTKSDLMALLPTMSVKTIESALKKLQGTDAIEKHGSGKSTFYSRKRI